jgi:hypothetical protein
MHDRHGVSNRDCVSGFADPSAEIEILDVQEILLVETADAFERIAPHEHAGAGDGVDALDVVLRLGYRRHLDTRKRRPARLEARKPA